LGALTDATEKHLYARKFSTKKQHTAEQRCRKFKKLQVMHTDGATQTPDNLSV